MANRDQKKLQCDQRHLKPLPAWYRFTGVAGDRMPTYCVPKLRCGTHAPGWLNGSHPSVKEGIVTRRVCYHWGSRCCNWQNKIQIKNCGAFYVYRLVKPPVCWLRYCGNNPGELSLVLICRRATCDVRSPTIAGSVHIRFFCAPVFWNNRQHAGEVELKSTSQASRRYRR